MVDSVTVPPPARNSVTAVSRSARLTSSLAKAHWRNCDRIRDAFDRRSRSHLPGGICFFRELERAKPSPIYDPKAQTRAQLRTLQITLPCLPAPRIWAIG